MVKKITEMKHKTKNTKSDVRNYLINYQKWSHEHPDYDSITESAKVDIYLKEIGFVYNDDPLINKAQMLADAIEYADNSIRRTIIGKNREIAKQRIMIMYLLDEMFNK